MKLLEARKALQEHESHESAIDLANKSISFLEEDLKHTKKTRDSLASSPGEYQYYNASVILTRQKIKYWKKFIQEAKAKMQELVGRFDGEERERTIDLIMERITRRWKKSQQ